jgi:lysophospholipase L1-like esterase
MEHFIPITNHNIYFHCWPMSATNSDDTKSTKVRILLVGDSDIERWPKELLPRGEDNCSVWGCGGATLHNVAAQVEEIAENADSARTIWVICAGENDIGNNAPLFESQAALVRLLDRIVQGHVIFLGPKLEPWLQDSNTSRKRYIQMSRAFQRLAASREAVSFVDCLLMFCSLTTANLPGGLFKARPDPSLFDHDQLHLSRAGYIVWRSVVEDTISTILSLPSWLRKGQ